MKDITARFNLLSERTVALLGQAIEGSATAHGIKMRELGQPIRVAITGGSSAPPIAVTLSLVGRDRTLARLDHAINLVEERAVASS